MKEKDSTDLYGQAKENEVEAMEPLMIRDRRYWLQKEIDGLDPEEDGERIRSLTERIASLQEICPHEHNEEVADENLWHCRDCDARRPLNPTADEDGEGGDDGDGREGDPGDEDADADDGEADDGPSREGSKARGGSEAPAAAGG